MQIVRADSTEYLYVPVTTDGDLAQAALSVSVQPAHIPPVWHTAETTADGVRVLIGPGTQYPLVQGVYHRVLVRVSSNPEATVLYAGSVFVS